MEQPIDAAESREQERREGARQEGLSEGAREEGRGRGGLRREIPAGAHRIEVRLGEANAGEGFDVAPGETWTYEVTPTTTP